MGCLSAGNIYRHVSGDIVGPLLWKFNNSVCKCLHDEVSSFYVSMFRISQKAPLCVNVRLRLGKIWGMRASDRCFQVIQGRRSEEEVKSIYKRLNLQIVL